MEGGVEEGVERGVEGTVEGSVEGGAEGGVEGGVEGGASGEGSACLDATLWLSPAREQVAPPSAAEVFAAAAAHWPREWSRGAALDLSGSAAKGAAALEAPCSQRFFSRACVSFYAGAAALEARVVRSQYLSMSQEAGSSPPQEDDRSCNLE